MLLELYYKLRLISNKLIIKSQTILEKFCNLLLVNLDESLIWVCDYFTCIK